RKHDIGPMCATITMCPNIDHKCAGFDGNFVSAKEKQHIECAGSSHRGRIETALARNKTEIERADACSGGMQDAKPVPAVFDGAHRNGGPTGKGEYGLAVRPCQCTLSDQPDL